MRRLSLLTSLYTSLLLVGSGCPEDVSGPTPAVTGLDPSLVCGEQVVTTIAVSGEALSPLAIAAATEAPALALPELRLRRISDLAGTLVIDDSIIIPSDPASIADVTWTSSTSMSFNIYPALGVLPGLYEISIQNPNGASATLTAALAAVPPPALASAEPDLFCLADGSRGVTLTGTGFLDVGGVLPAVMVGTLAVAVDAVDGCVDLPGPTAARTCTSAHITLGAAALAPGTYNLVLTNPDPAGCSSTEAVSVLVIPPPAVTALEPPAVCLAAPSTSMTAIGTGLIVIRGTPDLLPAVLVDGAAETVSATGGCAAISGADPGVEACTSITFSLPSPLAVGSHSLQITNPDPAGCSTTLAAAFDVAPAPTLDHVDPLQICADGGVFTVVATSAATGFATGATVKIRLHDTADAFAAVDSDWVDVTHITGAIGSLPAGLYDVTVENGAGCEATPLLGALDLVAAPFAFFADPPAIYDGIDLTVTIYVSGAHGTIGSVSAIPAAGGAAIPLTISDATQPGKVQVLVPAGLLAAGLYDILVFDDLCSDLLEDGLEVTSTLTVDVAAINPPFGWSGERIPVEISSTNPAGAGMVNFVSTPRIYLSPRTAAGVATEVRAITYLDGFRLSGAIPAGMPVDRYDLVVVNPDGAVGLLADSFEIFADPLPVIDLLVPGSTPSQDNASVTVVGANLASDAAVAAICRWVDVTVHTASITAEVTFVNSGALTTVWDFATAGIPNNAVCVLRETNVGDGTYADYSALSLTPASNTPNDFTPSNNLIVARRALSGAALRMNTVDRFVFAIGGDNGLAAAAYLDYASVERARVDAYGLIEPWVMQRNALPAARSFTTAATVGRFVYLPGGRVAGAAVNSVLRAYLLDPEEAPAISGLDLALDPADGLDAGLWIYRVAAVLGGADPSNPGGETLASEPIALRIPAVDGQEVQLTLFWAAVPNAASYRIYRTPTVDGVAGAERLLAQIAAVGGTQHYTDDGAVAVDPLVAPLPLGSLGVWHPVQSLVTGREGAAVVAVPDPNDASKTYLHVLGGRGAGGALLSSAEHATIIEAGANLQTISAFVEAAAVIAQPRWQTAAAWVDHAQVAIIPATDAWIYLLPGRGIPDADVNYVTAFKVDTDDGADSDDGRLGAGISVASPTASAGGFGAVARNGFLYLFAGAGTIDSASKSAEICKSGGGPCSGGAPEPPDLVTWNAGIDMAVGRILNGTAVESGFVFLLGGQTIASPATNTTESTNI